MDKFKVQQQGNSIIIRREDNFAIKVERDMTLTPANNGYVLEATLYKEDSTFVVDCRYIFEVIEAPLDDEVDKQACKSLVDFFFHSVLDTSYYVISVPKSSKFFPKPLRNEHTIYDIDTANLYDILSGY